MGSCISFPRKKPQSIVVLIDGLVLCVNSVPQAIDAFQKCYGVESRHPEYRRLRLSLYSEAVMFSKHIFPQTVTLVQHIKTLLQRFKRLPKNALLLRIGASS